MSIKRVVREVDRIVCEICSKDAGGEHDMILLTSGFFERKLVDMTVKDYSSLKELDSERKDLCSYCVASRLVPWLRLQSLNINDTTK